MAHSDILSQPDRGLGLDRPQTEALLALFSRCDDLREFGREVIQSVVNALMDSQAPGGLRRAPRLQVAERVNSRNGYRERSLSTSLGDLELRVPKLREGTYFPEGILERYTRVEASMVALVREMYVAGVSTRKVGLVAEELGVSSLSSSEVSALCAGLDEEAEAFRTRADRGRAPLRVARRDLHEVQDRRALRERRARHGDRHVVLRAQGVPRLRLLRQRDRGRLVRVPRLPQGQGPARREARGVRRTSSATSGATC